MSADTLEYYRLREQAERAAAASAASEKVRAVHMELADHYAALVRRLDNQESKTESTAPVVPLQARGTRRAGGNAPATRRIRVSDTAPSGDLSSE